MWHTCNTRNGVRIKMSLFQQYIMLLKVLITPEGEVVFVCLTEWLLLSEDNKWWMSGKDYSCYSKEFCGQVGNSMWRVKKETSIWHHNSSVPHLDVNLVNISVHIFQLTWNFSCLCVVYLCCEGGWPYSRSFALSLSLSLNWPKNVCF